MSATKKPAGVPYRTHEGGPLTTITIVPGAVVVEMRFESIFEYARLHSHTFDHWMECTEGSAMIVLGHERRNVTKGERYLVEAHQQHGVWPREVPAVLRCVHEHADIHPDRAGDGVPLEWLHRLTDEVPA